MYNNIHHHRAQILNSTNLVFKSQLIIFQIETNIGLRLNKKEKYILFLTSYYMNLSLKENYYN